MNQRISRCSILAFCALALTLPLAAAPARDIVQTAAAAGSFRTFSKALQISGLADTLRGRGPFRIKTLKSRKKRPVRSLEHFIKCFIFKDPVVMYP